MKCASRIREMHVLWQERQRRSLGGLLHTTVCRFRVESFIIYMFTQMVSVSVWPPIDWCGHNGLYIPTTSHLKDNVPFESMGQLYMYVCTTMSSGHYLLNTH